MNRNFKEVYEQVPVGVFLHDEYHGYSSCFESFGKSIVKTFEEKL